MRKNNCNKALRRFLISNLLALVKVSCDSQKVNNKVVKDFGPDSCSSDSEGDEEIIEQAPIIKKDFKKQRNSVSAEAYGFFNKREHFKPRLIPKSAEIMLKIDMLIAKAFMFSCLDSTERKIIVDAMEESRFEQGQYVIKQGEEGNFLYVIEQGQLDCLKKYQNKQEPTYLKTYIPGESFGELALLYNAPRAASIISKTASLLWALDRETFNHIVKDAAMKKRQQYEEFLTSLPLLKRINDPYEKTKIADAIESRTFPAGHVIIQAGQNAGDIYFVETGQVKGRKNGKEVYIYRSRDYFGQIPVVMNKSQPFDFVCDVPTTLLVIGGGNYKTTLAMVEKELKEETSLKYQAYL